MRYILLEHQTSAVLLHQIQSLPCIFLQSYGYFLMPPEYTETIPAFLPGILHNIVLPHNAYGLHPGDVSPSARTEEYHELLHPYHKYNERHWSPPAGYRSPGSCEAAADLHVFAPECRDPAVPERNFLCRRFFRS